MRILVLAAASIGALLLQVPARADMGLVAIQVPQARLYEPTQDALIAWSGKEELLILQTEVHASQPTKVLEILPLPSEPAVSKGSARAFRRVQELIDERIAPRAKAADALGDLHSTFGDGPPAGRVTQRKTIGAHDISVAQVLDAPRFATWVERYLKDKKLPETRLPEDLLALITTYTRGGFRWFVLDVVEVGKRRLGREPIQYRFKTSSFFYPLRISRRADGRTRVQVSYLAPRPLAFGQQPVDAAGRWSKERREIRCKEQLQPFRVGARKLATIDPAIADVLRPEKDAWTYLGRVHCVGKLSAFEKDLVASLGAEPPAPPAPKARPRPRRKLSAPSEGTLADPFR